MDGCIHAWWVSGVGDGSMVGAPTHVSGARGGAGMDGA